MLDQCCYRDGHLTRDAFSRLDAGGLSAEDRRLLLAHMEACADCMDTYIETLTEDALLSPPEGMEDRILGAVRTEYVRRKQGRVLAVKFTKLAVAVCLTMVLFMGGVFQYFGRSPRLMLEQQMKLEQPLQPERRQESGKPRKNAVSEFFSEMNNGFIDFAKNFNSFSFIGDGKK